MAGPAPGSTVTARPAYRTNRRSGDESRRIAAWGPLCRLRHPGRDLSRLQTIPCPHVAASGLAGDDGGVARFRTPLDPMILPGEWLRARGGVPKTPAPAYPIWAAGGRATRWAPEEHRCPFVELPGREPALEAFRRSPAGLASRPRPIGRAPNQMPGPAVPLVLGEPTVATTLPSVG